MATAALTQLPQEDDRPASVAKRVMPWLLSTASHLALILVMALLIEKQRGVGDVYRSNQGVQLTSVQSVSKEDGGGGSVEVGRYYADDDSNLIESPQATNASANGVEAIRLHDRGELASLFDEPPPVNLDDLVASAGTGESREAATPGGDVPNAAEMIRSGSGHAGVGRGHGSGTGDGAGPVGIGKALAKGAARTGIFGVSGVGYKFVYVFDRSGSMDGHGGAPLAAAKAELIHSLRELDHVHQFQIIFYNEHPRAFTIAGDDGRLVFGTEQNKRLAERFVGGITADGATQHEDALALALRLDPDVIFFLTDADEPTLSPRQLAHIARMNNGTTINAVEFGYGPQTDSNNFLVKLARQNGGQHVYVDISELPQQ